VKAPREFQLVSVYEQDRLMMEFLDNLQLRPGVCFSWVGRNYDETVTLQMKSQTVQLGTPVGKRVWVARPLKASEPAHAREGQIRKVQTVQTA